MSNPSLKAAKEAAMKVTAMLVASGQLKATEVEKTKPKTNKGNDLFVEEVIINDAPMSARNYLTRSVTQEEISKMSGASVSTKGRYISPSELNSGNTFVDRPLHLQIQGVNQQDVKVAVGRIMHLIMEHTHKKNSSNAKSKSCKNFNAAEKVNPANATVPPTNPEENPVTILREKVFMPMTPDLVPVEVCARLLGDHGTNFQYIKEETGLSVVLRGIGSGYVESDTGQEAPEPLHFYLEYPHQEQFNQAKDLVVNLAQTVLAQIQEEQQGMIPHVPINNMQQGIPNPQIHQSANIQPFTTQQLLVQPCPTQLMPAVPTSNASLNSILTQSVAPLVHVSQSLLPPPTMVATQATAAIPDGQTPIQQLITLPVATSTPETVLSQQLVQTSAGPQLVQIPPGSQIISTPEGPRLLAVIPTVTSTTVVTQGSLPNLNYTRPLNETPGHAAVTTFSNVAPLSFVNVEKPKNEQLFQGHPQPGVVYLPVESNEHLNPGAPTILTQSFVNPTQPIETQMPAQAHVVLSQNNEPPSAEHAETAVTQYSTGFIAKAQEEVSATEDNRIEYQHGAVPPALPWSQYPVSGSERNPGVFTKPGDTFEGVNTYRNATDSGSVSDGRSVLEGGLSDEDFSEPHKGFYSPAKRRQSTDYESAKRTRTNRKDGCGDRWASTSSNGNGLYSGQQKNGNTPTYASRDSKFLKSWRDDSVVEPRSSTAPPPIEYNHSMPPSVRVPVRDVNQRNPARSFAPRNPQVFSYQNSMRMRKYDSRFS